MMLYLGNIHLAIVISPHFTVRDVAISNMVGDDQISTGHGCNCPFSHDRRPVGDTRHENKYPNFWWRTHWFSLEFEAISVFRFWPSLSYAFRHFRCLQEKSLPKNPLDDGWGTNASPLWSQHSGPPLFSSPHQKWSSTTSFPSEEGLDDSPTPCWSLERLRPNNLDAIESVPTKDRW